MGKWKTCELGNLIKFQRGHDLPKSKMVAGKYPVVGSNGIIGWHNEYTTEAPSITVGRSGNVGNPFIYYGRTWSHNTTLYIKEYKNTDPVFIYYFLKTLNLSNYAGGSAVPTLNRNHIHTLKISVPETIEEQHNIGIFLKLFDDKIQQNIRINKNLEALEQAYFCNLFITNANSNWRYGTLSDLGTIVGGGTPSKKHPEYYAKYDIPWITPKDLSIDRSKFISRGENDISELGFSNSSVTKMPKGTILFSSRAPIGYIAIALNTVTTNQGFKSVIPNENVGSAFMYFLLKQALPTIEGMASGSTFKEISGSGMKSVPVVIPDDETLQNFSEFCIPLFEQQIILEAENRRLSSVRDILLPKLMSGKIDVANIDL